MALRSQHDSQHEDATFTYLEWQALYHKEKPFELFIQIPDDSEDKRWTNQRFKQGPLQHIQDLRGNEDIVSLDKNGFEFCKHAFNFTNFDDHDAVAREYLPEVEKFIMEQIGGVEKVYIFNWERRCSTAPMQEQGKVYDALKHPTLGPALAMHVDQTALGTLQRVRLHMGDEAEELLKHRVRIINIWRPIKHAVQDYPLALVDGRTLRDDQLIAADYVKESYVGDTYWLLHDSAMRIYYLNQQQPDEVALFKQFDSDPSVVTRSAHSSFRKAGVPVDCLPRESVEVRALIFGPLLGTDQA